jgi:hypothetical protein
MEITQTFKFFIGIYFKLFLDIEAIINNIIKKPVIIDRLFFNNDVRCHNFKKHNLEA